MKLSQGADYGMAAIIYLSQKEEERRYSLEEISQATQIPEEFLRKIFQSLAKSGAINSFKGRGGGVSLAHSPKNITVAEIIKPLEKKVGLVRCLREKEKCARFNECLASNFWQEVEDNFWQMLKQASIKNVIEGGKQNAGKSGESPA